MRDQREPVKSASETRVRSAARHDQDSNEVEYVKLGRTGLSVSRVGFGGGGIGQVWGPTTEAESVRAVHRALELGVNVFDVASSYGHGKAEEVLGRALQGRPEPVIVATKVRLSADDLSDVAGAVRRSVDASLRRLRRDTVDILLGLLIAGVYAALHCFSRIALKIGEPGIVTI